LTGTVSDPRKLRPGELCRLLNSTPLGEVISEGQLRTQRSRAGLRIGDGKCIDLVRYVAWLVLARHAPKPDLASQAGVDLTEAAVGAAALGNAAKGHGLTSKQEARIAALLSQPTHVAAAAQAGVSESTLYRWLQVPAFRAAYRQARRELVEAAIGRVQAAAGGAVEALVSVAHKGRRDGDRVRAAMAILDHAHRGLSDADTLHGVGGSAGVGDGTMRTTDVVQLLAGRLRQLDSAELPSAEKARLTATVADTLLRAISVDVIDQRLEALQSVLGGRKAKGKK
jgi:hypothetical protein